MTWEELPTPCYVIDEKKLKENLIILHRVEEQTDCHILLAQKAFSCYSFYSLIGSYISGTTASGLYEARLGKEEMGKENHVFAPAYKDADMRELAALCDHVIFNSAAQYERHHKTAAAEGCSIGLRVNPEYSTQEGHAIYDPCAPGSRLGVTLAEVERCFPNGLPDDIEGLHFHTLCEQDADDLERTFYAFEKKFKPYLKNLKWLNLGGGHHITRPGYQLDRLTALLCYIRDTYGVRVYLEPGEAVALNAGYLVTEVQDIVSNGMEILILDASAACHMPDVLEMPYRPPLRTDYKKNLENGFAKDLKNDCESGGKPGEKAYTYRLSSMTCLAGDVIGDYSFSHPIHIGDRLVFEDMAIYSMVKNNTFNGMPLPGIACLKEDGGVEMIKTFGYDEFKRRL